MEFNKLARTMEKASKTFDSEHTLAPGKERQEALLDLSSEWYWEQDEQHRITQIRGKALATAGFNVQDFLGMTHWDCGGCPVGDDGS